MERKTKVEAQDGKQEVVITREFELPVDLLFRAYEDPDILAQWMNTRVLELENRTHGGWRIETSDPKGNVVFQAHGVHHEFVRNERITRTFEMINTPFGVQLEFLRFERLTDDTSKLTIQIIYQSPEHRHQMLQLPFAYGVNMAHNKLEEILSKLK